MIEYRPDHVRNLNYFICYGRIRLQDIQTAARGAYRATPLNNTNNSLWDMRHATLQIAAHEVFMGEEGTQTINRLRPSGKTAFVFATHLDEAFWSVIRSEYTWLTTWAYFQSLADAYRWVSD